MGKKTRLVRVEERIHKFLKEKKKELQSKGENVRSISDVLNKEIEDLNERLEKRFLE